MSVSAVVQQEAVRRRAAAATVRLVFSLKDPLKIDNLLKFCDGS